MRRFLAACGFLLRPRWAGRTDLVPEYEKAFAETLLGDASVLALAFWRGRVALWAILRAAGVSSGEEVVLPAYTCEMVPAAVKFAGGTCVYVDAAPSGCNCTIDDLCRAVTGRTRAIICQHTYGVAMPVSDLARFAAERGITLIEDCCHLITPEARFAGVAAAGHAAIFSTQWNKPFSTGLGGMATFRDAALHEAVRRIRDGFPAGGDRSRSRSLALQVAMYDLTVSPATQHLAARLYRWTQRRRLLRGSTQPDEYGQEMPAGYLSGPTNVQAALGIEALGRWRENVEHRRRLTEFYLGRLAEMGIDVAAMRAGSGAPALWCVPVFVENMDEMLRLAGKAGVPLATWFGELPAHAAPDKAARYDYRLGQCPRAEWMFLREVNLLTWSAATLEAAEGALALIEKHAQLAHSEQIGLGR